MENPEKDLRKLIRKTLQEMNDISESDLLVRAGVNWDEAKPKFLEKVNNLISKIDDDQYDDAEDLIGSVSAMLKMWRAKIKKGKNDMVDKVSYSETLDEDDEYKERTPEEKKIRQQKEKKIRHILHKQGADKKYSREELGEFSIEKLSGILDKLIK